MTSRRSTRAGSLFGRLRSILTRAWQIRAERPLNAPEPDWEVEDHLKAPTAHVQVVDPWDPEPVVGVRARESRGSYNSENAGQNSHLKSDPTGATSDRAESLGAIGDSISDGFGAEEFEASEAIDDERLDHETSSGADLGDNYFDYDPDAHQLPWDEPHAGDVIHDNALRRAREKAASIVSVVEVTSRREQEDLFGWLTELFLRLKHPATFQAIERIALHGITADLLQRVVALRDYWMERQGWWAVRYGGSREVRPLRRGSGGLTWAVAVRVCRTRADYAPEEMIDEDWFDEWLNLAPHVLCDSRDVPEYYYRFSAYIDAKVSGQDQELLNCGLVRLDQSNGREEMGDDRAWWRKLPRYEEDIRFGFAFLTPFRDGFGPPGYPENQERVRGGHSES